MLASLESQAPWSLADFVQTANALLPQFLPAPTDTAGTTRAISPRLVRYYVTSGFIDRPVRRRRASVYGYRQLVQLLLFRRILLEGYSPKAVAPVIVQKSTQELQALLEGGITLRVETANPALASLSGITERHYPLTGSDQGQVGLSFFGSRDEDGVACRSGPEHWSRMVLLPGVELHLKSDFVWTGTQQEREILRRHIEKAISDLSRKPRRRRSRKE